MATTSLPTTPVMGRKVLSPASSVVSLRSEGTSEPVLIEDDGGGGTDTSQALSDNYAVKRKRGGPTTTGLGADLLARRLEREARRKEEEERRKEEEVDNPLGPLPSSRVMKALQKQEGRIMDELLEAPTPDLSARMIEQTDNIFKIADCSNRMSGPMVSRLRKAAVTIKAAATTMAVRAQMGDSQIAESEMAALRREIKFLRLENTRLQGEVDGMRVNIRAFHMAPPPLPPRGKKKKRSSVGDKEGSSGVPSVGKGRRSPSPARLGLTEADEREEEMEEWPRLGGSRLSGASRVRDPAPPPADRLLPKRPPIRGVSKALDPTPLGLVGGRKERYNEITSQIGLLLAQREGLMRSSNAGLAATSPSMTDFPPLSQDITQGGGKKKKRKGTKGSEGNQSSPYSLQDSRSGASREGAAGGGNAPCAAAAPGTPKKREGSIMLQQDEPWARVVGRRERRTLRAAPPPPPTKKKEPNRPLTQNRGGGEGSASRPVGKRKTPRRKPPKSAAVTVTCPEGKYREVMGLARQNIRLVDLDIQGALRARRAVTGALILEVPGADSGPKADALASRLREVFEKEEGVRVARPIKKAELRVRGLEDSATAEEIASAVALIGGCESSSIRIGALRYAQRGLGTTWIQCPLDAAMRVAKTGRIRVGWTEARVELLDSRPLQCFKCLERGHVQQQCGGGADRSDRCYRCGVSGHKARECGSVVRCPVCTDLGRPADHRLGSAKCTPPRRRDVGVRARAVLVPRSSRPVSAEALAESCPKRGAEVVGVLDEPPKEKRPMRSRKLGTTTPVPMEVGLEESAQP